ncbi:hypothetical protein KSP40_PGU007445 [Platanthera guangdongensis]|uniref:CW-type domain-containing protein n=1 Tax=Platanthera guangdongensis TaxID=2320717 RepID=A0ABR2ME01_9ASPA
MEARSFRIMLTKDEKPICLTRCNDNLPIEIPATWAIVKYEKSSDLQGNSLPQFRLFPDPQNSHQKKEWGDFLSYLKRRGKAAIVNTNYCSFYIVAPDGERECAHCIVLLCMKNPVLASDYPKNGGHAAVHSHPRNSVCSHNSYQESSKSGRALQDKQTSTHPSPSTASSLVERIVVPESSRNNFGDDTPDNPCKSVIVAKVVDSNRNDMKMCRGTTVPVLDKIIDNNLAKTNPSYLTTLGQTHSAWIFGAIAELVDNSRDAHATRLDISVDLLYSKNDEMEIPVLSIIDDGDGMTHSEILRMLSFGHKQANGEDPDRIGRFGIGFKTGAMRLGRDALVLTQSSRSRSVAFLSQSYNDNKDNIEIPIVSYSKNGRYMELDLTIQSEEYANFNLSAIKEFSPFNEYLLGEQLGLFGKDGTGTQIFIWNLDKWGSDYTLEWVDGKDAESYNGQGDILIRSRRIRSRLGQISREVPLDYSLQAYLEVIFLNPLMKIFVQCSLVRSYPLEMSLSRTVTLKGSIMARPIQLILGQSQVECNRMNSGVFLYWNGRLIEAYKRVGGMKHNGDVGRGVIGVSDITYMMVNGKGQEWVLNSKQGFQDCEAYAKLEDWLGIKFNEYWDENFDNLNLVTEGGEYEPDHKWVHCDNCLKRRMLTAGFNIKSLSSSQWFCYMAPFNGTCQDPEQVTGAEIVTVAATRYQHSAELLQTKSVQSSALPQVHVNDGSGLESRPRDPWRRNAVAKRRERGPKERSPVKIPKRSD